MIDRYERNVSIQSIMGLKRTDAQSQVNYHQQLQQQLAFLHQIQQLQQPPQQAKKPHRKRKRRRRKKKGTAGAEAGDDSKEQSSEDETTPDRDADNTDDKTDDDTKSSSAVPIQANKNSKSSESKSVSPGKDERISLEKIQEDDEFFIKEETEVQEKTLAGKEALDSLQEETIAKGEAPSASNENDSSSSVNVPGESQKEAQEAHDTVEKASPVESEDANVIDQVNANISSMSIDVAGNPTEDLEVESTSPVQGSSATQENEHEQMTGEEKDSEKTEDGPKTDENKNVEANETEKEALDDGAALAESANVTSIDESGVTSDGADCTVEVTSDTKSDDPAKSEEIAQSSSETPVDLTEALTQLQAYKSDEEAATTSSNVVDSVEVKSSDASNTDETKDENMKQIEKVTKDSVDNNEDPIVNEPKSEIEITVSDLGSSEESVEPVPHDRSSSPVEEKSIDRDVNTEHDAKDESTPAAIEKSSDSHPAESGANAPEPDADESIEQLSAVHFVEPERLRGGLEKALKQILKMDAGPEGIEEALREHLPQQDVPEEIRQEIKEMIREKMELGIANQEVAQLTRRLPRGRRSYSMTDATISAGIASVAEQVPGSNTNAVPTSDLYRVEQIRREQLYWQQQHANDPYLVAPDLYTMTLQKKHALDLGSGHNSDPTFPSSDLDWSDVASNSSTPSSPASRGPRHKKRRNRNQPTVPLPKLDMKVKTQLMTQDWVLPSFHTRSHESPVRQVKSRMVRNVTTFTHPKDFAMIQRMMQDELSAYDLQEKGFASVLKCTPRTIQTGEVTNTSDVSPPDVLMIHQSCSTEDLECRVEGVEFLKACFPSVSEADHLDILQRCEGDVEWAVNILLDSGYEYNEPGQSLASFSSQYRDRSSPEPPARSPLPLLALCQEVLIASQVLASEDMQDNLAYGSVRRLHSIEELRHQLSPESSYDAISYRPLQMPEDEEADALAAAAALALIEAGSEESETEMPPLEAEQHHEEFVLTLPPQLSIQLAREFGPVNPHIPPELMTGAGLQVRLDYQAAKELHRCWANTLASLSHHVPQAPVESTHQDEELARRWQEEENRLHRQMNDPLKVTYHSAHDPPMPGSPHRLTSIMDEQMAMQLTQEEYSSQLRAKSHEATLATKLKRKELYKKFPNIGTSTLDEIYRAHGYSLDMTVETIQNSLGKQEETQNVMTPEAVAAYEKALLERAKKESSEMQRATIEEEDGATGNDFQSTDDPTYKTIRAEASVHFKLRHECFQKAQEAHRRGMRSVASFYSQQGHIHSQKLKEANQRAAAQIMEHRESLYHINNTVDLHHLHVAEALQVLENLLAQREQELAVHPDKRRQHVFVVTGRGRHSQGGVARIRPAVRDFLNRKKYSFTEMQPGLLRILLR